MLKAKTTRRDHGLKEQAIQESGTEEATRLNVDIPKSLHKKLKMRAIEEENTTTQIVIKAVTAYLATPIEDDYVNL